MKDDDWFKIYEGGQDNSIPLLKDLIADIRVNGKTSKKKNIAQKGLPERLIVEKKKLLDIVITDLVLEYRFALTYLEKIRFLDWSKDEETLKMLIQLASQSMNYSASLSPLIEKLGEKSGKVHFPYAIENYPVEKIIGSHLILEKKILGRYELILANFQLDDWLRNVLIHVMENKSKNLKNLNSARLT